MNILIMGCSYGVPRYRTIGGCGLPWNYHIPDGSPFDDHTEFLLRDLGYNVYNHSMMGQSNSKTLALGLDFANFFNEPIDWIIWFHTEIGREDFKLVDQDQHIDNVIEDQAKLIYDQAYNFHISHPASKWIIIGGLCPIHKVYYNNPFHSYIIPSWLNEMAEENLPDVYVFKIPDSNTDTNELIQYADDILIVYEFMCNSECFPDNCHPGPEAHHKLTQRIHKICNK